MKQEAKEAKAKGNRQEAERLQMEASKWEKGGSYRQALSAVTNGIGLALGGAPTEGVIAGTLSPYINTEIKKATEGNDTANILANGVWGAMEAASQGGSALGGAAAAMTGEAGAKLLAEQLYGQSNPEHLSTEQKQTLSELSQVLAGATAGTVSGATGGNSLTAVQAAATGMGVAKSAVENNAEFPLSEYDFKGLNERAEGEKYKQAAYEEAKKNYPKLFDTAEKGASILIEGSKILADFIPVVGDVKAFSEAETKLDYFLATLTLIPGSDELKLVAKGIKSDLKTAELLAKEGNIAESEKIISNVHYILRSDNNFTSMINERGQLKSYIDGSGNLVPANINGKGSIESHIRGGNSINSPYISATDSRFSSSPKLYGKETISIDIEKLEKDINIGRLDNVEVISHESLTNYLENRVNGLKLRYEMNPTAKNAEALDRAISDLSNVKRDGECLIKGCIPQNYLSPIKK